jgi:hypothetical protein
VTGNELAPHAGGGQLVQTVGEDLDSLRQVIALYRHLPRPRDPEGLVERVRHGIVTGEWQILT